MVFAGSIAAVNVAAAVGVYAGLLLLLPFFLLLLRYLLFLLLLWN